MRRAVAALALVVAARTAQAEPGEVGLIDMRSGGSLRVVLELRERLSGVGVTLGGGGEWEGLLTKARPAELAAWRALREGEAAYAARECARAITLADSTLSELLRVREVDGGEPRTAAHALALVCADQLGDQARARAAARALGQRPGGVPEPVWQRWAPVEVDVIAGVPPAKRGRLRIESSVAHTFVVVDGRDAGEAPVEVDIGAGAHTIVGLAVGHDPGESQLDFGPTPPQSQTVLVKPRPDPEAAARVALQTQLAWHSKFEIGAAQKLAQRVRWTRVLVLDDAGVRLVEVPEGIAGPPRALDALQAIAEDVARSARPAPSALPSPPPSAAPAKPKRKGSRVWPWIAAGTVAAVALGIILVQPSGGDDTLHFHVQVP